MPAILTAKQARISTPTTESSLLDLLAVSHETTNTDTLLSASSRRLTYARV